MVRHIRQGKTTHAKPSVVEGILGIALYLDKLAIFIGIEQHAATQMTPGPGPCASACDREIALFVGIGLLVRHANVFIFCHVLSYLSFPFL